MNDISIHLEHNDRPGQTTRRRKQNAKASLRAAALPWAAMVIASVVAAAYVSYQRNPEEEAFQRWLESSHHKPVFDEHHKPLFPLSTSDRVGFSLAICGLMIAAGGGIGGGGILVPIYILVMGFSPKHGEYYRNERNAKCNASYGSRNRQQCNSGKILWLTKLIFLPQIFRDFFALIDSIK